jgi:hypothetical protein
MLVAERRKMTGFGRTLWRFMQQYGERELGRELTRTDLAEMITNAGLEVESGNIGQWMNGDRHPPAGLPYYSAIVLNLSEEDRCALAWAYLTEYKDVFRGRNKKNADIEGIEGERGTSSAARGKGNRSR